MPAPERVSQWIAQNYPKPTIDPEWLSDCCQWISSECNISPSTHFHKFIEHVELQLLRSNLGDSTVPGTGIEPQLPGQRSRRQKHTTGPVPLLVEIRSITDIAQSAFSLLNTHQTRLDRADLGLAQGDADHNGEQQQHVEEDEGPIPRFPRGMLRFELSDGCTTFRAIEFRSLAELELGVTPLGYKVRLVCPLGVYAPALFRIYLTQKPSCRCSLNPPLFGMALPFLNLQMSHSRGSARRTTISIARKSSSGL
ncbi:hypothetical protein PAXRUDRAFT_158711 [Paxillus rubicundulus Ve08.2h10]|uniref:RecQ-mediated genome instability protein 1 n=1 Tax=Paxillus rubicundulus Ve08.2h10 TaxID=930991 RepID=A0A0D0CCB4_9AGAM|nr:hypothetical protein PAXRUDRAFT_158711 [Paxillus rubicundulus Ve08.2h10]